MPSGNTLRISSRRRGVALLLALMLTVFLFVLGVSLLYFVERDGQAGLQLQRAQKVLVMAQSGILFARYAEMKYGSGAIVAGLEHKLYSLDSAGLEQFEIWKESDPQATIHSRGLLKSSRGDVLASRELAAPTRRGGSSIVSAMNLNVWDAEL